MVTASVPTGLADLPAAVRVPPDALCVYVSGSIVAGWGHANSDVDLYVVTREPAEVAATARLELPLLGTTLPVAVARTDRVWDAEYWTEAQVNTLIDAVSTGDETSYQAGARLGYAEVDCFYRLSIGVPLVGKEWLADVQHRIATSALGRVLASREFAEVDGLVDDALGMLETGDRHSAVLAAGMALGHAVDGYLFARGSLAPNRKWRYRKLAALPDSRLSADEFWRLVSMRELDDENPRPWVEQVAEVCQLLIMEVDFG